MYRPASTVDVSTASRESSTSPSVVIAVPTIGNGR